jgi:hypothetical protein
MVHDSSISKPQKMMPPKLKYLIPNPMKRITQDYSIWLINESNLYKLVIVL